MMASQSSEILETPKWIEDSYLQAIRSQNFFLPITKAVQDSSGRWLIEARANMAEVDLQDETIDLGGLLKSLDYFKRHGKFNWDHGPGGTGVNPSTDPEHYIGQPIDAKIENGWLVVKGFLYNAPDAITGKVNKYVREAWRILKSGGTLGMSIEGKRVATVPYFHKGAGKWVGRVFPLLTNIAITPKPINAASMVTLAKALNLYQEVPTMPKSFRELVPALAGGVDLLGELKKSLRPGEQISAEDAQALFKSLRGLHGGIGELIGAFDEGGVASLAPDLVKAYDPGHDPEEDYDEGFQERGEPHPSVDDKREVRGGFENGGDYDKEGRMKPNGQFGGRPGGGIAKGASDPAAIGEALAEALLGDDSPIIKAINDVKETVGDFNKRLEKLEGVPESPASTVGAGGENGGPAQRPGSQPAGMVLKAMPESVEQETLLKGIRDGHLDPEAAAAYVMTKGRMRGASAALIQNFAKPGVKVTLN